MRKTLIIGALLGLMTTPAFAAKVWVTGNVEKTIVSTDDKFGGCLMTLSTPYNSQIGCANGFLSLDCAGDFGTASEGRRRLDQVLLAAAMGVEVRVQINSARVLNGWCAVDAVQVIYPSAP